MGLFSRKPKISIELYCRDFYDQYVFGPEIGEVKPWPLICETDYKFIVEADATFQEVDLALFTSELRILWFEVVGIAWFHHVKEEFAPVQSEFTKRYLHERDEDEIWISMEGYNQATARSAWGGRDSSSRLGRGRRTYLNVRRARLFDLWVSRGLDPVSVARAANRLGSKPEWKSHRVHNYLSFALTDRLSCKVNEEGRFRIMVRIEGLYRGASESIRKVKIVS